MAQPAVNEYLLQSKVGEGAAKSRSANMGNFTLNDYNQTGRTSNGMHPMAGASTSKFAEQMQI